MGSDRRTGGAAPHSAELEQIGEVLRLYALALCGQEVRVLPRGGTARHGADWLSPAPADQARTLWLPPKVEYYPTWRENFEWYKVVLTQQAGHVEFGTFHFMLERPARLFSDWRPRWLQARAPDPAASDLECFRRLFPDRALGATIFVCLEAARIRARVLAQYPGIRVAYQRAASQVLAQRPSLAALPLREALLEALVQGGLGADPLPQASAALRSGLVAALAILARLTDPRAIVEDTAEAALRVYVIAARLPNVMPNACDPMHHQERPRPRAESDDPPDQLPGPVDDRDSVPFTPPSPVAFHLELASDALAAPQTPHPASADEAEQEATDETGPLTRDEPFTYLYPEWDFRVGQFRARWCRVRERILPESSSDFYAATLAEYRWLVALVRARFEHFLPELLRKVPRQVDGEDFDLDSVIERLVDLRAGVTPSEKVYWRRGSARRDVAVALLLDMSATTNEYIRLGAATTPSVEVESPQAYSRYLARVAAGVDARGKPLRKQVIQIEKEAAIVLMQALESIGDSYALYAFSGSGRGNVEFHVVKEFQERLSQRIARRLDSIAPAHATRMGAAVRHAVRKLERVDARTRLLFLVSDGRPYDRDYGENARDQAYAVRDTRQALLDAKQRQVRPFCLTVDKDGADYMQAMCADVPYEVVARVEDLPLRLLEAYPKLTR
jgi:nitric oxide reductase activation protein